MNKVCAVVVTYNRKDLLKECVDRLLQVKHDCFEILIIDNASDDGTQSAVDGYNCEKIYYYNTGQNIGGAGGFNYGIKCALDRCADYVWLMDDDTFVDIDTLDNLLKAVSLLNNQFGFLCSKLAVYAKRWKWIFALCNSRLFT